MDKDTITFTEAAASVISAVVAVLAVGLGGFLQWRAGVRQFDAANRQMELSATVAREQMLLAAETVRYQTIAPMRQAWINHLRSRIALFISISADLRVRINQEENTIDSTFMRELLTVEEEIYLLLHKGEADHDAIADAVRRVGEIASGDHADVTKLYAVHKELREITQSVLKKEWEVTKKMDAKIETR